MASLKRAVTWRTSFKVPCGENSSMRGAATAAVHRDRSDSLLSNSMHLARFRRKGWLSFLNFGTSDIDRRGHAPRTSGSAGEHCAGSGQLEGQGLHRRCICFGVRCRAIFVDPGRGCSRAAEQFTTYIIELFGDRDQYAAGSVLDQRRRTGPTPPPRRPAIEMLVADDNQVSLNLLCIPRDFFYRIAHQ